MAKTNMTLYSSRWTSRQDIFEIYRENAKKYRFGFRHNIANRYHNANQVEIDLDVERLNTAFSEQLSEPLTDFNQPVLTWTEDGNDFIVVGKQAIVDIL